MNDEVNQDTLDANAELASLKQRATLLGIKYSPNIGVDALRERVNAAVLSEQTSQEDEAAVGPVSKATREARLRDQIQKEELRLIRVRIANMNPEKKDLHGEIFTVASKYLGNVKKFIPYGEATDDGYHIPNVIFKALKARKFNQKKTVQNRKTGAIDIQQRWVPEFSLEVLPPLTKEELAKLAASQAAAKGL